MLFLHRVQASRLALAASCPYHDCMLISLVPTIQSTMIHNFCFRQFFVGKNLLIQFLRLGCLIRIPRFWLSERSPRMKWSLPTIGIISGPSQLPVRFNYGFEIFFGTRRNLPYTLWHGQGTNSRMPKINIRVWHKISLTDWFSTVKISTIFVDPLNTTLLLSFLYC